MGIRVRKLFTKQVNGHGGPSAVAEALECSRQWIHYFMQDGSKKRPGKRLARDIESLLGVPASAWESVDKER